MSRPKGKNLLSADELRGLRLQTARKLLRLNQEEMGEKLGVTRQAVIAWEKGGQIQEWRMEEVSRAYKASKGWIRYGEGEPPAGLVGRTGLPLDLD